MFSANIRVIKNQHFELVYCNFSSLITEIYLHLAKHTFFCSYKAGRHAAIKTNKQTKPRKLFSNVPHVTTVTKGRGVSELHHMPCILQPEGNR